MAATKRLAGLKSALETAARGNAAPEPARARPPATEDAKATGSREGRIHVGAWLPAEYKTSLRLIQTKPDKSNCGFQELIAEALNDLFAKYDVPVIRES
jgi:hypothetical protein